MDDYWAKKDAAKKEAEAAPEVEEPADADAGCTLEEQGLLRQRSSPGMCTHVYICPQLVCSVGCHG